MVSSKKSRPITIGKAVYRYLFSLSTNYFFVWDADNKKHSIALNDVEWVGFEKAEDPQWFGKNDFGGYGPRHANFLITKVLALK